MMGMLRMLRLLPLWGLAMLLGCTTDFDAIQAPTQEGEDAETGGQITGATGGELSSGGSSEQGGSEAGSESPATGGSEDGTGGATGGTEEAATGGSDVEPVDDEPTLACVADLLGTESLGEVLATSTAGREDQFTLSCASGASNDVAYEFHAPASDYYVFDTGGSTIDTVLALVSDCDGTELACNDNTEDTLQSEVLSYLEEGQTVAVVVDGNTGESGDVQLHVSQVTCPSLDLTGQPLPVTKDTSGGPSEHSGACGGADAPERSYRFTPTSDGLYRFRASSEVFVPALYLEDGARCDSPLLGCSMGGNQGPIGGYPAEVTRFLHADEPVTVIVDGADGGSGLFDLDIEQLDDARTCPSLPSLPTLESISLPNSSAFESTTHLLSASCAPSGATNFSSPVPYSDDSYPLKVAFGASTSCTYQLEASQPIAVYLLEGSDCSGAERLCVTSEEQAGDHVATFSLNAADNGDYVLVVESLNPMFAITYSIFVACLA